ncbi:MAG: ABC transporter substrate-binding protein [Gammaproteobacteria bacterium]|nr:ABC transporter substrate-binding protein [Gammaproteobacteria bacterium]
MKLKSKLNFLVGISLLLLLPAAGFADEPLFKVDPTTNNGEKWYIGYYEGGAYINYQKQLTETIKGLMQLGWMETAELPKQSGESTDILWKWLSTEAKSDYIEFVADAHYSAMWENDKRNEIENQIVLRLNNVKDIDLMIGMGTWAGKGLANYRHRTNTLVFSTSNPISSGIIKSVEDSGFDHVHVRVDPKRNERQLKVFHEMIGFHKLGVAYEDSLAGRAYAAIETIEALSETLNFEIIRCHTKSDIADKKLAEEGVMKCFTELSKKADAIYVTQQGGVNSRSIPKLVKITNQYKIPTFSQSGAREVSYGVLASLSRAGYKYVGRFHAETIAKVFNGAQPSQLNQLYEEPPKIALNLKTAEIIGFDPPIVLLGATDEFFEEIKEEIPNS